MAEEIAFLFIYFLFLFFFFLFLALDAILITGTEPFKQILVKADKKNIFMKSYWNRVTGWGGDSVSSFFFLFLTMVAILIKGVEPFKQF